VADGWHGQRPVPTASENPAALSLCSPKATTRAGRFTPNSAIVRRFEAVGRRTAGGVPYLDPTIQLLFKAKNPRPEDIADFNAVVDSTP
jgi:hypothetical protein